MKILQPTGGFRLSIEQYNKELDEAEFERGEYISSDEIQKLIRESLKKAK